MDKVINVLVGIVILMVLIAGYSSLTSKIDGLTSSLAVLGGSGAYHTQIEQFVNQAIFSCARIYQGGATSNGSTTYYMVASTTTSTAGGGLAVYATSVQPTNCK